MSCEYNIRLNNAFLKIFTKDLIKQCLFNVLIVILIMILDLKLKIPKIDDLTINYELFSDLLIASVGISGVFLGLYCSNMMSIFTSRYINAPKILADLFERDFLVNKCIKSISQFLVLSIIVLILNFIGYQPGFLLIIYCAIKAIMIIISYGLSGRRSFQISDVCSITEVLYLNIRKNFDDVAKKQLFRKDNDFQNHYRLVTKKNLEEIEEIIDYTLELSDVKESTVKKFLDQNILLLRNYMSIKNNIVYDSFWYEEEIVFPKWHRVLDTDVNIALTTGTSLQPKQEKNYFWIENSIYIINEKCLSVILPNLSFKALYHWMNKISSLCEQAVFSNDISVYLKYADSLKKIVLNAVLDKSKKYTSLEKGSLVENLMLVYIKLILSMKKYVKGINVSKILDESESFVDFDSTPKSVYYNHSDVRKLYNCIQVEIMIEGRRITPDWYINQIISKHIYDEMIGFYGVLDEILNHEVPDLSKEFFEKNYYFETMIIYSRMREMKTKSDDLIECVEKNIEQLKEYHKEKSIIWNDNPVSDFKEKQDQIFSELPEKWSKCSSYLAAENFRQIDDFPDFIGECYNHTCEFLIANIENSDYVSFEKIYKNFVDLVFIYSDVIKKDLLSVREPYLFAAVCNVMASPVIEFGYISGYAYILGEISNNECWKNLVTHEVDRMLKQATENGTPKDVFCKNIFMHLNVKKNIRPVIYNRDTIHSNWKNRFMRSLLESKYLAWEDDGFIKVLKSENMLLKAIVRDMQSHFILRCEAYEVFAIEILNKYVKEGDKFKSISGWEDKYDK